MPVPAAVSMLDPDALTLMTKLLLLTAPFDYSGSPTISVPCGFTADAMPLSLQLVGRHFEESTLIRVAAAYERSTRWHLRHPSF
jgi:Asp-tRNA(Asn)/Glu-tRNA(Gln) amidotransferase A subunit family amidase